MASDKDEAFRGLGRKERRRMKKRWKEEGGGQSGGQSLKEWAKKGGVGDASVAWLENKRGGGGS
jgi:hypothetical protein